MKVMKKMGWVNRFLKTVEPNDVTVASKIYEKVGMREGGLSDEEILIWRKIPITCYWRTTEFKVLQLEQIKNDYLKGKQNCSLRWNW